MRKFKTTILKTISYLIVFFIFLEIMSRLFFPGSWSPDGAQWDEKYKMYKFSNARETGIWTKGLLSQQRAKWRINNEGWNSAIDYFNQKADTITRIAVIGDSYIEAFQVDVEKHYSRILNNKLGKNYEVYSFGNAQASLAQYLHIARYVKDKFSPDIYIFNLYHNDFDQSIYEVVQHEQNPFLTVKKEQGKFIEIEPSRPKYLKSEFPFRNLIMKSSLFRYFIFNLDINDTFLNIFNRHTSVSFDKYLETVLEKKEPVTEATEYLIRQIKAELSPKLIVFVMDAPRSNIYQNDISNSKAYWLNTLVSDICQEYEIKFFDLTTYMMEDYKINKLKFETKWDNHWNEYGHNFIANILYNYLKNN